MAENKNQYVLLRNDDIRLKYTQAFGPYASLEEATEKMSELQELFDRIGDDDETEYMIEKIQTHDELRNRLEEEADEAEADRAGLL